MPEVQYEDFRRISDLAHETSATVNALVPVVKQLAETSKDTLNSISLLREEISDHQSEMIKSTGDLSTKISESSKPDRNTLIAQATLLLTFLAAIGIIGKLYVDNRVTPIDKDIGRIEQDINKLDAREYSPRAREEDARISAKIENMEKALEFHQAILKELRDWHINGKTN